MRLKKIALLEILLLLVSITVLAKDHIIDLQKLLAQEKPTLAQIEKIAKKYSADSLYILLKNWNIYPEPSERDTILKYEYQLSDTIIAPYYLYVPRNYDVTVRTPLLVYLHGGVGRTSFLEDGLKYCQESPFIPYAKRENFLILFPMGNIHCTWWSDVGIQNIEAQIKFVKMDYNIDDDRVFVTGFSDGGSASFHLALVKPTMFASFYPLNGYISVGSLMEKVPVYLPNLANRYVYAINTDKDALYPAKKMAPLMELCLSAGANLLYREYYGIGHEFTYAEKEIPKMINFMKRHARQILHPKLYWECAMQEYNICDWLCITKLDTLAQKKDWQLTYQSQISDERIVFGFYHDEEYQGEGVKVNKLVDGESVAKEMDLRPGDIVKKMDSHLITNIEDLTEAKKTKKRGDAVTLEVIRDSVVVQLNGKFPEVRFYDAFVLNKKSGAVKARYWANHFDIETSCVDSINIRIHPDMVQLDNPVIITIDGKQVYNDIVKIDSLFLLREFINNCDRSALWVNELLLGVPKGR